MGRGSLRAMIRTATAIAAAATLLFAIPATAPASALSQQERLDARYDRALAAGYKALMLCGAIASAERIGEVRTEESVAALELTGIQAPLDGIVGGLTYRIFRAAQGAGALTHVEVDWSEDMPPRFAWHQTQGGCALGPVGMAEPPPRATVPYAEPAINMWHERIAQGRWKTVRDDALGEGYGKGTRTTAIIVAGREGPGSHYAYTREISPFTPQRTWSVAKSIAATLVGAAAFRGEADVTASAGLGEGDADPRRAITIDHLLRMASGRYSDTPGNRTDSLYWGGATVDEVALDWPLIASPGSSYRYANNDTLAAVAAIKPTFAAHPPAEFFAKLGMKATVAETDWQGNYILSSQVWTTANDLAKFGQLYLNDGKLPDGTRILPEGWVKYVATPSGPQPDGAFGYGAGFWLMNKSDGVPPDTFAAFGNRGQYVVIVPSRNVVIVRRGEDPVGASFDIAAFTRDVLAALESE